MRRVALLIGLLATVATAAAAQPWSRERDRGRGGGGRGGELVLYEHDGFGGRQVTLNGPEPDLTRYGFNDAASSLRAQGAWEVCEHVNFQGSCVTVNGEQWSLPGFNDRISSARPVYSGGQDEIRRGRYDDYPRGPVSRGGRGGGLVLFEHVGFAGRAIELGDDEPDLNRLGFNDAASSIRVSRGAWRVCSDAYYRGLCVIVQSDLANLNDLRLNDRVSSIQRIQ